MKSRIVPAIAALVDQPGWYGTKETVARAVCCDTKTAWRVLTDLWLNGNLYVAGWERKQGAPIQVFKRRRKGEKDVPRMQAMSAMEKKNLRIVRYGRDKLADDQRAARHKKKMQDGEIRLGIWGL